LTNIGAALTDANASYATLNSKNAAGKIAAKEAELKDLKSKVKDFTAERDWAKRELNDLNAKIGKVRIGSKDYTSYKE